jgi:probable HAF family extracellular repeat protein
LSYKFLDNPVPRSKHRELKGTFGMKLNAATLLILAWSAGASAQTYKAIDLGKLVSGDNNVGRMNNGDQIIGGDSLGAILWAPSGTSFTVTRLGDPSVASYAATSINSSGQVVGFSQPLGSALSGGVTTPIVFRGSTAVALPTLGGTSGVATSINDAGLIVGQSRTASETDPLSAGDAVLWNGSEVIDLGTVLGGNDSFAEAINNSNQIVGTNFAVLSGSAAVVWTVTNNQVTVQNLPVGAAIGSEALDINDSGKIVGLAIFESTGHAALWSPTGSSYTFQDLGDLGGGFSVADSINKAGDVVGNSLANPGDTVTHATLWTGGKIVDLNAAVTPVLPAFITLDDAVSINDGGSIVVGSVDSRTGAVSSYLLVPIQPLSLSCPAASAQVAVAYSSALAATGGSPPYKFSVASGLPPGLALNAGTGVLAGTPITAGSFNFTAQVTDSSGVAAGTVTLACSIIVRPQPDFAISVSPAALQVASGSQATSIITTTALNGFAAQISLQATGVPTGANVSFVPITITASAKSTLTFSAGSATSGTFNLIVTATGGGRTHSVSIPVTIEAGRKLKVSPTILDFGTVRRFGISAKSVKLENIGAAPISISRVSIAASRHGQDRGDFTSISSCKEKLPAGRSCSILVIFFAKHLGPLSATLKFPNDATGSLQSVPISAEVVPFRR